MVDTKTSGKLSPIASDDRFVDAFAEGAGVTRFSVNGQDLVNLTFLSNKLLPYVDDGGNVVTAKIEPQRVASITMTFDAAKALMSAMNKNLESTQSIQLKGKKS